jgi:glutaredoxin
MFRIVTRPGCGYCVQAKDLLTALQYNYEEDEMDTPEKIAEFKASGFETFPQIYRDEFLIGGHDDLLNVIKEKLAWTN